MRTAGTLSVGGGLARPRRQTGPGTFVRLRARLRARSLDHRLASGAPSWQSAELAARALRITAEDHRQLLARSYETLLERSEYGAAVPPSRRQILHATPLILAVSARLRSTQPLDAHGVAQLRELIVDGAGPCYRESREDALSAALEQALRWLDIAG